MTADVDLAAAAVPRRSIQDTGHGHGPVIAAVQDDLAPVRVGAARMDLAAHLDRLVDDALGGSGGQQYPSAVDLDFPVVRGQGLHALRSLGDRTGLEVNKPVAVEIDREGLGPGDDDGRALAFDDAVVAGMGGDQGPETARAEGDVALVDDPGIGVGAGAVELVAPAHEVVIGDIRGSGQKASGLNRAVGSDGDPVLIDQPQIAVGLQQPVDMGRMVGDNAIEGNGVPAGLVELSELVLFDAEAVPVDDGLAAVLIDRYLPRLGCDGGIAADHHAAGGIGADQRGRQHDDDTCRSSSEG